MTTSGQEKSNGTDVYSGLIVSIIAVIATLMVLMMKQLGDHASIEGHPGVLKITSSMQADITSLKRQADERAERLGHIEATQARILESQAGLAQKVVALDTMPTLVSRLATVESGMHFLLADRDRRIGELVEHKGATP